MLTDKTNTDNREDTSTSSAVSKKPKLLYNINKYCDDKSEYYAYHRKIEEAFQRDSEEFLQKYEKLKNMSFNAFVKLWRQVKFVSTFPGLELIEELPYFADSAFYIIRKLIKHGSTDYIKVGALYLLCAIYSKQQKKNLIKIKLTRAEYNYLLELAAQLIEENDETDFDLILKKMANQNAFQVVSVTRVVGLDLRFVWQDFQLKNDIFRKQTDPVKKEINSLLDSTYNIENLAKISQEYDEALKRYEEETGKIIRAQPECTTVKHMAVELQKLKDISNTLGDITILKESESENEDTDEEDAVSIYSSSDEGSEE